jgi:homoserine kinase type II
MSSDVADLSAWGLDAVGVDSTVVVEGSSERSASRCVAVDQTGSRWILEQIDSVHLSRKQVIAEQLERLSGLEQVHPYLRTTSGSFFHNSRMLRAYVEGVPLPRPGWLDDAWRLDAMTAFLIRLRKLTVDWNGPVFSIAAYARERMDAWRVRYPKLAEKLEPFFQTLEKQFFSIHDQLPMAFCHGDFHPLNMVWGESSIRSVIDWEFCGMKPELYDVALLIGCIGFEDPDNLIHEPVARLVRALRATGSDVSWDNLLELVATIRFGWMSEWIRRRDEEAIEMESVYLDILVGERDYIRDRMF